MNYQLPDKKSPVTKEGLAALIVSTFLAFIVGKILDPFFSYLYSLLLNTGGSFMKSISNSTYQQISNGFSEQASVFSLYLIDIICLLGLFYFFTKMHDSYKNVLNKYRDYDKALDIAINPTAPHVDTSPVPSTIDESILIQRAETLKNTIAKQVKYCKINYYIFIVSSICASLLLTYTYARNAFVHSKITTITNNIEIVSPYISDIEYKMLKSDFYSIENSEDYDALTSTLNDISKNHSIKLKE